MGTFTIITANNAAPPAGLTVSSLGTDAYTNFSQVAGNPNSIHIIGNSGDKVFDTVSRILYIYNYRWVPIAFAISDPFPWLTDSSGNIFVLNQSLLG